MNQIEQILSELSEDVRNQVLANIESKDVGKGEVLIKAGEVCHSLFWVQSGALRTYFITEYGDEVNIEFSLEGQFLTSIDSFYNGAPSLVAIESLEQTSLLSISSTSLYNLYEQFPVINKLGRLITEENFVRREQWHARKYSMTAKDRYMDLLKNDPTLIQRIPLIHLASYLGITKEHLSRIRAQV